ncbi:SDR family oxidoreductase [Candidatus Pacearchaeota archaeon]|nr:SDR family oxidoreductase [Candidatus Pacearchaeota archaeon]
MAKERVLITGGAGYLGSVLTGHLLKRGYSVACMDNLLYKQGSLRGYMKNPNFSFFLRDAREKEFVRRNIPDFDVIIPLAAIVGMPACDKNPESAKEINRDAIIMLDGLRSSKQKIIFPTTNSGYGTKTGDVFCTEETPLEPISLYGKTKCEAEKYLLESGKGAITLRLATVFGMSPRMRTDLLVNDFVLRALCEGEIKIYEPHFKRNFAHIQDIARCFVHCIENYGQMVGRCYNVGLDSANISKLELAGKVKEHVPEFKISEDKDQQDPDKRNYVVSNKRLRKAGFECLHSLDKGIEELIGGYNQLIKSAHYNCEELRKPPYTNV